jgi:hypothetical protein
VTAGLTGLAPNTTYHYRLVAANSGGTSYGADLTLTTAAASAPVKGSGGGVFKDILVPSVVKRGSRVTVGLTLKKKGRVSFEIRKGGRSLSKTTFPPETGKVRLKFKAPSKPTNYRLIISVKTGRGKPKSVNTIFTVTR